MTETMPQWLDVTVLALFRIALVVMLGGVLWRVARWLRTPAPRQVVLTPAPRTRRGVLWLMLHETVLFTTLFRASPWTWLFGWSFHVGLALVLLQHLRYVTADWWGWVNWLAAWGHIASAMMLFGLLGLLARRCLVDRMRFISRPSDYAALALLLAIALSGIALKYLWPTNVLAVKAFVREALFVGETSALPGGGGWLVHLLLALALIAVFAWGKLMHGPALWVNPVRAQRDDVPAHGRRSRSSTGH